MIEIITNIINSCKQPNKVILFIVAVFVVGIFFSCQKLELNRISKIATDRIEFQETTVHVFGKVIDISNNGITEYGFYWALHTEPTISNNTISIEELVNIGIFSQKVRNIIPNKIS